MPKEIERRFLVRSLDQGLLPAPERVIQIEQGYLELRDMNRTLRVRICDGREAYLAMKLGKGIERDEIPSPLGLELARLLMSLCKYKLKKERRVIQGWEIDTFKPPLEGIIIAERELASRDEKLVLPPWFKDAIEVTDTLTNRQLARLASELGDAVLKEVLKRVL